MDFQIGDVVNRTFGAISRNFVVFFLLSFVLVGIPTFVLGVAQFGALSDDVGAFGITMLVALIVNLVATYILQGALIHGAVVDFNGGRANFGACLSTGLNHFFPLTMIAILMTLGIMLGTLLLIVPGIILSIMWLIVIPVQVVENTGITEALSRSRELTRGNRWKIFGLYVIFFILASAISLLVMLPVGLFGASAPGGASLVIVIFQMISTVLTAIVSAAGVSALYYELRKSKEGVGAEALAKVFD